MVPRYQQARAPIIRDLLQPALLESASAGWAFLHSHDARGKDPYSMLLASCTPAPCPIPLSLSCNFCSSCLVLSALLVAPVCMLCEM